MNKIFSLFFLLCSLALGAQDVSLQIITQDAWPPGKNVPVTIVIEKGGVTGFARFYHNLPKGFIVQNVKSSGADFFWDNNQVNYVWVDLPTDKIIRIQYLASADMLLAGSFKLSGRFDYIVNGSERLSVSADPIIIRLDKRSVVEEVILPDPVMADSVDKEPQIVKTVVEEQTVIQKVDFRIQVSISSQRFSQAELEERIGCRLKHGVTVLKTGNMFKYQSGAFPEYQLASEYLGELKAGGVTDAFVVAFRDNIQISIKEARELEKR